MAAEGPAPGRPGTTSAADQGTVGGEAERMRMQPAVSNEAAAADVVEKRGSAVDRQLTPLEGDSSESRLDPKAGEPAQGFATGQDAGQSAGQSQRAGQQASLQTLESAQTVPLPLAIQTNGQPMPLVPREAWPSVPLSPTATDKPTQGLAVGSPTAALAAGPRQPLQRSGTAGDRSIPVVGQFVSASGEMAAMVRDSSGAREPGISSAGGAGTAPALRETFAALDGDVAPGATLWTHASTRQAEAGFEDPALGWIGVRAERDGIGVHGSVVPGSDAAARELGTHLEGLSAYMAENRTPLESLAMAAPEGRGAGHGGEPESNRGNGQSSNQDSNHGTGQNSQQKSNSEPESTSAVTMSGRMPGMDPPVSAKVTVGPGDSVAVERTAGSRISVMA